jgi:type VII secretion integral membrane protein EccD
MTMATASGSAMTGAAPRRVTVIAPHTRMDVALPPHVTVAELVPQLAALTGLDTDEAGASGWLLSRLGADPLEPAESVTSAGVRDGELLYLVPRGAQLPPAVFDDVVDAVADDAERRAGAWRPSDTARTGLLVGVVALAAGLAVSLTTGPPWTLTSVVLAAAALAGLVLGAILSRSAHPARSNVGATVCASAVASAGLAAATAVAVGTPVTRFGWPELLGAAAAVAFTAGLASALVSRFSRAFAATCVVALVAAFAAAAAGLFGGAGTAAVLITLAFGVTWMMPMTALRLARLAPAPVPADMEQFRAEEGPVMGRDIVDRAIRAERNLDALTAGQAAVVLGAAVAVVTRGGVAGLVLAGLAGLAFLLRSRLPRGRAQRRVLVVGGLLILVLTALTTGLRYHWQPPLAFAVGGVAVTAMAFAYAARAERQPSLYVARALDVVEFLALASILPVTGAVLDLYSLVRGLGG